MQKGNCGLLLYVHGDDTEDKVLRKAGITRAAGLVAIVANDADNVFITLTAGGLNSTINIVARAEKPEAEEKLRRVLVRIRSLIHLVWLEFKLVKGLF